MQVQDQSIGLLSSPLKVLPSSVTTPWFRIESEQCSFLCRRGLATLGWESLASSQHACTSWCASVPAQHVDCISLQSAWVEPSLQAVIKILWFFFESTPLDWTYFRLKTARREVLINDKFLPEPSFHASQNETQLASSETWAWRYQFSVRSTNTYTSTECSYSNVLRSWMEYLITRILKAIK